jgi:hypothetical protein
VSQKLIRSLARPLKVDWLYVQLDPGSRKGQNSREADHRRCTNGGPHFGGRINDLLFLPAGMNALALLRCAETREHGYCDKDRRKIYISPHLAEDGTNARRLVLVHEICHAVSGLGHRRKFCERIRKASRDGNSAGEQKLSELLESEAVSYEETPSVTASEVYGIVEGCVRDIGGSVSYPRCNSSSKVGQSGALS